MLSEYYQGVPRALSEHYKSLSEHDRVLSDQLEHSEIVMVWVSFHDFLCCSLVILWTTSHTQPSIVQYCIILNSFLLFLLFFVCYFICLSLLCLSPIGHLVSVYVIPHARNLTRFLILYQTSKLLSDILQRVKSLSLTTVIRTPKDSSSCASHPQVLVLPYLIEACARR